MTPEIAAHYAGVLTVAGRTSNTDGSAVGGVVLYLLDDASGVAIAQTTSGASGAYAFTNLIQGSYTVVGISPGADPSVVANRLEATT